MASRVIVVDRIPQGSNAATLWRDGALTRCEMQTVYLPKPGVVMAPIASDEEDAEPVFLQMHTECWQVMLTYDLSRIGSAPVIPTFRPRDNNYVFLDGNLSFGSPTLFDGQYYLHKVSGWLRFGLRKGPRNMEFKVARSIYYLDRTTVYRAGHFRDLFN